MASELEEKLRRRRQTVDEKGLQFESCPQTDHHLADAHHGETTAAPASPALSSEPAPTGVFVPTDFQTALNRRRNTVNNDGQTFESKPSMTTADCAASGLQGVQGATERGSNSVSASGQRAAAAARLATVTKNGSSSVQDVEWETFESKPTVTTADCKAGFGAGADHPPPSPATSIPKSPPTAQLQPPSLLLQPLGPAAQPEDEDQKEPEQMVLTSMPTPTRACVSRPSQESDGEDQDQDQEEEQEEEATGKEVEAQPPRSHVEVKRNRVDWQIFLGQPATTEDLESQEFSIGSHTGLRFQLRQLSEGCELTFTMPVPAPKGMKARLWAAKGWKKGAIVELPADGKLTEKFPDVNLGRRHNLKCGLVFTC